MVGVRRLLRYVAVVVVVLAAAALVVLAILTAVGTFAGPPHETPGTWSAPAAHHLPYHLPHGGSRTNVPPTAARTEWPRG